MSGIRLVESGNDLASGFLEFSELVRHLERRLATCQTGKDLAELIKNIKAYTGSSRYSATERQELGKIRQRAYDRKRRSMSQMLPNAKQPDLAQTARRRQIVTEVNKRQIPDPAVARHQTTVPDVSSQMPDLNSGALVLPDMEDRKTMDDKKEETVIVHPITPEKKQVATAQRSNPHLMAGINRAFSRLDSEALVVLLGRLILPAAFTLVLSYFLWSQSVELYAASGFVNPGMVALGGLLMVMGFAAFHSISRSKLALLCCLYAGVYETYFIASGTAASERQSKVQSPQVLQESAWRQEQVVRAKAEYDEKKAHFDDPSDKMHQNNWYKINHLNPAWEKYSSAQAALNEHNLAVSAKAEFDHIGWLKILYRLGLVFLCMLLVHRTFQITCSHNVAHRMLKFDGSSRSS